MATTRDMNGDAWIDDQRLAAGVERLVAVQRPRYRRLWTYFKNPMRVCGVSSSAGGAAGSERPYRQGQEWGLPPRITGVCVGGEPFVDAGRIGVARKEVVIENDIGWRVETMVDYLFGRPVVVSSAAADPARREVIGRLLRTILANHGGVQFLQEMATIGSVYGFVDVLVKACGVAGDPLPVASESRAGGCGMGALGEAPVGAEAKSSSDAGGTSGTQAAGGQGSAPASRPGGREAASSDENSGRVAGAVEGDGQDALIERAARMIRLEIVEPARALPLLSCEDYRVVEGYGQVWEVEKAKGKGQKAKVGSWWERLFGRLGTQGCVPLQVAGSSDVCQVVEVITADSWARYEDGVVVARGGNSLGEVPLVHVQNSAAAFEYCGASDVEPLIPLQDELNTRLSDRAHRISLQSFKMYLGKGIDGFNDHPVAPGRMWMTDNEQAQVQEFGGDSSCPSEEAHIADLREALDKSSGVTPIAAGALKNRIGRLTSAAALRVTLLALLSKTDKKRTLYGAGIERICELALRWLDVAGVFKTTPAERRVELSWPSPLPENEQEKLDEAEAKVRLGVDRAVVLRELGY
ncbi:MAG TPA: phage portal protein [Tepidisphaeraceae bacterium]